MHVAGQLVDYVLMLSVYGRPHYQNMTPSTSVDPNFSCKSWGTADRINLQSSTRRLLFFSSFFFSPSFLDFFFGHPATGGSVPQPPSTSPASCIRCELEYTTGKQQAPRVGVITSPIRKWSSPKDNFAKARGGV